MRIIDRHKDDTSINETEKNVRGIVGRLEIGTIRIRGEEKPLTKGQKRRRLVKLEEQNEVLRGCGIPEFRVGTPGQD